VFPAKDILLMKNLKIFIIIAFLCAEAYSQGCYGYSFLWAQWSVLETVLERIPDIFVNGTLLILTVCGAIIISTMKTVDLKIKNTNTSIAFILALIGIFMLIWRFILVLGSDIFDLNLRVFVLLGNIFSIYMALVLITTPYENLNLFYLKFNVYLVNVTNWLIFNNQTILSFLFTISLFEYPKIFIVQIWFATIIIGLWSYAQPLVGLYLALILLIYILVLKYPIWQNYTPFDRPMSLIESCWYYESILTEEKSNNLVLGFFVLIMRHSLVLKAPVDDLDTSSSSPKWSFSSTIRNATLEFEHAAVRFSRLGISSKITYTIIAVTAVSAGGGVLLATKYSRDKVLARVQGEVRRAEVEAQRDIANTKIKLESERDIAISKLEIERDIAISNNTVRLAEIELAKLNAMKKSPSIKSASDVESLSDIL